MKVLAARRKIAPPTMPPRRHPHALRQQSLAWLLWLALLLPMAQTAAVWHGLSHVAPATATAASQAPDDPAAPHGAHCDLCLSAATVGTGALPGAALPLPVVALRHVLPRTAARQAWLAPASLAYQSRAPPLSPA